MILGPALGGFLYEVGGFGYSFIMLGIIYALCFVLSVILITKPGMKCNMYQVTLI